MTLIIDYEIQETSAEGSTKNIEIPIGYKMTDLGIFPADWEIKKLKENINLLSGQHVLAQDCNENGKGIPYITGPADFPNGSIKSTKFTSKPTTICRLNDILITVKGSGAGALVLSNGEYCISRQLMAIRVSFWNENYIYYLLILKMSLFKLAATGLIPGLSRSDILENQIPVPSLAEQKNIAAALCDIDLLINRLDQLIAKKRNIKLAAMQQLLTGKRRLPGFNGEWNAIQLGVFGQCLRGVSYKGETDLSPTDNDHTIRLFRSNNIQDSKIIKSNLQYVTSVKVSDHQVMRNNDILICMANGSKELVGKAGLLIIKDVYRYTFGAFMGCFRTNTEKADPRFVFYLLQSNHYRNNISNLLAGSSINNLKPSDIESIEFFTPSLHEQAAIANILSDMDTELSALEQQLDKARKLKQGMMEELLTGRIRLK